MSAAPSAPSSSQAEPPSSALAIFEFVHPGVNKFQILSMAGLAKKTKPAKRLGAGKRGSVWHKLREAQRKCGCTTSTLKEVLKAVEPFCGSVFIGGTNANDEQFFEAADAVVLCLHGCVKCNQYVFEPTNNMIRCPKCRHPRFNQKKKPNEVCCCQFFFDCLLIFLIVC